MTHIQTRPTRFLIASLALLGAAGCVDSSGPGNVEDPGVLLVPIGQEGYWPPELVWTKDGGELIYAENGLSAVSIGTHVVRQLDASPLIVNLVRGNGGEGIYFGAFLTTQQGSNDPNFRVSRVNPTAGAAEIITTTFPGANGDMFVSDDERFLVVGRGLYDLQTAARIDLPAGRSFGFSPDGTQLLFFVDDGAGLSTPTPTLISTINGSSQPLVVSGAFYLAHRWEGNSPKFLTTDLDFNSPIRQLYEIDGLTGARRHIADFEANPSFGNANWSPDGQVLGIWIQQGQLSLRGRRTNLYVIRSGGAPAIVANVNESPGPPVFSPNGNSVAYFNYYDGPKRSLYMKSGI
ncbi:MAG TPA: hypothetical protein VF836_00110 [Gemmatimonadaceae bacterium]